MYAILMPFALNLDLETKTKFIYIPLIGDGGTVIIIFCFY